MKVSRSERRTLHSARSPVPEEMLAAGSLPIAMSRLTKEGDAEIKWATALTFSQSGRGAGESGIANLRRAKDGIAPGEPVAREPQETFPGAPLDVPLPPLRGQNRRAGWRPRRPQPHSAVPAQDPQARGRQEDRRVERPPQNQLEFRASSPCAGYGRMSEVTTVKLELPR
jgi:hypothetical protein